MQFVDFTDEMVLIARRCPALRSLAICGLAFDDHALELLSLSCRDLRYLGVVACSGFSITALVTLAQRCPHAQVAMLAAHVEVIRQALECVQQHGQDSESDSEALLLRLRVCEFAHHALPSVIPLPDLMPGCKFDWL
jgi:hypothetical protein